MPTIDPAQSALGIAAVMVATARARMHAPIHQPVAQSLADIQNRLALYNVYRMPATCRPDVDWAPDIDIRAPAHITWHGRSLSGAVGPLESGPDADLRAARAGLGLARVVRWHAACPRGEARDDLASAARDLVDSANSKGFVGSPSSLIDGLPTHMEGCETLPWTTDETWQLGRILGNTSFPVNMGVDASILGARSLAGIVIAHLWTEPLLQRAEGPKEKSGIPLPFQMPSEPGTLLKKAMATAYQPVIERLASCNSLTDIKTCLVDALAPFTEPQRLPDGKIAFVDRLRNALAMVDARKNEVHALGRDLMNPPPRRPGEAIANVSNPFLLAA